jgi:cobalamin-dependent methionine synthase I
MHAAFLYHAIQAGHGHGHRQRRPAGGVRRQLEPELRERVEDVLAATAAADATERLLRDRRRASRREQREPPSDVEDLGLARAAGVDDAPRSTRWCKGIDEFIVEDTEEARRSPPGGRHRGDRRPADGRA